MPSSFSVDHCVYIYLTNNFRVVTPRGVACTSMRLKASQRAPVNPEQLLSQCAYPCAALCHALLCKPDNFATDLLCAHTDYRRNFQWNYLRLLQ